MPAYSANLNVMVRAVQKAGRSLLRDFGEVENLQVSVKGSDKEHRFIIDPLDGTFNFLHGLPHWCISVALEKAGEVIVGVVYDPVKDELFTA